VGEGLGRPMPAIGLIDVAGGMRPAHVRAEVRLPGVDVARLRNAADVPVELALLVDDPDAIAHDLDILSREIQGLRLARILVNRADGVTTPAALIDFVGDALGSALDGVPVVGGSSSHFSELNRLPVDPSGIDGVAFAISPTVHATDGRSIMSTLPVQAQVVEQTRHDSGDLAIVVSPVTLDGAVGADFADAWSLGSVAQLAAGGASSITYAHPTASLARAASLHGRELRRVTTSDDRVAAVAAGSTLMVANLTPHTQRIALGTDELAALGPYEVRELALDDGAASS